MASNRPNFLESVAPARVRDPWAARLLGLAAVLAALGSSGIVGGLVANRASSGSDLERARIKAIGADAKAARAGVDRIDRTLRNAYDRDTHRWQLTEQALCKLNGAKMFRGMNCFGEEWWRPKPNDFQWGGPRFFADREWSYIQRPDP